MGSTILVVGAEDEIRQGLRALLHIQGYEVAEAADGIAAWAAACRARPDLIVVHQPTKLYGGRALLDSIRANVAMEGVHFLIISSTPTHSDEWSEGGKAIRHLGEPLDVEEYLRVVAELLPSAASGEDGFGTVINEVQHPLAG